MVKTCSHEILRDGEEEVGRYPSDHYPILSSLTDLHEALLHLFIAGPRRVRNILDGELRSKMDTESGFRVREATAEDAPDIQGLVRELAATVGDEPPAEEAVRERLGALLDAPGARILVVENESAVVGAVSLWIKPDIAHGDTVVEVPMLVITEDHRRTGIGRLLMDEVRNIASDNGASQIELVATTTNVAAREFYSSLGFVEADVVALEFVGSHENPPQPQA
jgi:ribosomal protein S18 acetylase RimI-like enzyme